MPPERSEFIRHPEHRRAMASLPCGAYSNRCSWWPSCLPARSYGFGCSITTILNGARIDTTHCAWGVPAIFVAGERSPAHGTSKPTHDSSRCAISTEISCSRYPLGSMRLADYACDGALENFNVHGTEVGLAIASTLYGSAPPTRRNLKTVPGGSLVDGLSSSSSGAPALRAVRMILLEVANRCPDIRPRTPSASEAST